MVNPASPSPSEAGLYPARPNVVVGVLAFAGVTAALMQTLVVPLIGDLPSLLNTSASSASWVVTVTLLTGCVATPITGRLGDLWGKRRLMLVCAMFLVVGSGLCALSSSVESMVMGRGLQGVGMGLVPLGISAMRDVIPAARLGTSIALMSASMGVGGALGLPLAAAVAEGSDWRILFWGATGLALIVLVLIAALVPPTAPTAVGRFDLVGAIGLGIGLVCLLLGILEGGDWGWGSPSTIGCLVGAVLVLTTWGLYELRTTHPLVDLRVTARPVVLLTNLASLVVGFALYAQSLLIPQLLQLPVATGFGLGQSMLEMGLWMLPGGVVMMGVARWGASVSKAKGPRITLALGASVIAVGYLAAVLMMGTAVGLMVSVCTICGGAGLAYGALPALIMGSVPRSETGSANSVNTLMRAVGITMSAAVSGALLTQLTRDVGGISLPSESGFRVGLLVGCGAALLAAFIAFCIPAKSDTADERQAVMDAKLELSVAHTEVITAASVERSR